MMTTAMTDAGQATAPVALQVDPADLGLLLACIGFQAKALADPALRDRLYRLWCRLDAAASRDGTGPV